MSNSDIFDKDLFNGGLLLVKDLLSNESFEVNLFGEAIDDVEVLLIMLLDIDALDTFTFD